MDGDSGSLAGLTGEVDGAAGAIDDGFDDGQAEAGAAGVSGARGVAAIETVKDMRQHFGSDAVTAIFDDEVNRGVNG